MDNGPTEDPASAMRPRHFVREYLQVKTGTNVTEFSGPDREANAQLFLRAQHMGELVRLVEDFLPEAEFHIPGCAHDVAKIRAVLAQIGGGASIEAHLAKGES